MLLPTLLRSHARQASFLRTIIPRGSAPLPVRATPDSAALVGLEHEYRVVGQNGAVDFRGLVHGLQLGWPFLDPADANAYRLTTGAAVTADEAEAEIALPPLACAPGFARRAEQQARAERDSLQRLLGAGLRLEGWSTHVSVSSAQLRDERVALAYARTFAPALMLLLEGPSSPGLLVRPRPQRIELGGEFANGARLRAVLAFAVGSVLACRRAMENGERQLPPKLSLRLQIDDRRYGWYVDRRAFGPDLYREGRRANLPLVGGGTITAQRQLEVCWAMARETLSGVGGDDDLEACEAMVSGAAPLAIDGRDVDEEGPPASEEEPPSAFGQVLGARERTSFELAPVMVSWQLCVFLIVNADRTRRAFACVPRSYLESFVERLDSGGLDETIDAYLLRRSSGRTLNRSSQTVLPGLYDELGPRANLLSPEWDASYKLRRRRLIIRFLRPRRRETDRDPALLPANLDH